MKTSLAWTYMDHQRPPQQALYLEDSG